MMSRTRSRKFPENPRYEYVKTRVNKTLLYFADNNIPVNLSYTAGNIHNLILMSYNVYQEITGVSREYIIKRLTDSEEGGLLRVSDKKGNEIFIILYNETKPIGRTRFTIAHELGHYFLNHHHLIDDIVNSGRGLTDKEYDILEKEANYFARLLLVPLSLIPYMSRNWGKIDVNHIVEFFNVSNSVASHVISHLNNIRRSGLTPTNTDIINKFKNALNKYINIHICNNCYSESIIEEPNYCPICQKKGLIRIMSDAYEFYNDFERGKYMIYSGIEVNKYSKAKVCPVCENEEPEDGEYCSICGTHITNRCTNPRCINGPDDGLFGAFLPGNARYCTYCGSESTFLKNQLLKPWQEEKFEREVEDEIPDVDEIFDVPF